MYINIDLEAIIPCTLHCTHSADGNFTVKLMTKATIHSDGKVVWKPPAVYKSLCPINVEFFPFDEQLCTLKIGSWTYDGYSVDIRHKVYRNITLSQWYFFGRGGVYNFVWEYCKGQWDTDRHDGERKPLRGRWGRYVVGYSKWRQSWRESFVWPMHNKERRVYFEIVSTSYWLYD